MKKKIIFFLCITIYTFSNAQKSNYIINGFVQNEKNNPIDSAKIFLIALKNDSIITETYSDAKGYFTLSQKENKFYLIIGAENFKSLKINVSQTNFDKEKKHNLGIIKLKENESEHLSDVTVFIKKNTIETKDGKKIFNINNVLANTSGSIANLLTHLPTVISDIEGNITIRGKEAKIQINGRSSNLTRKEALQILPSNMIDKIELITNPDASEGSAPIINIITNKNKTTNGGYNITLGIPKTLKGSFQISYTKNDINLYSVIGANISQNDGYKNEELKKYNTVNYSDVEFNNLINKPKYLFGEVGFELNREKSTLFSSTSYYYNNTNLEQIGTRSIFDDTNTINENLLQNKNNTNNNFSFEQNVEYKKYLKNKKQEINIETQYQYEKKEKTEDFLEESTLKKTKSISTDNIISNELELEIDFKNKNFEKIYYSFGGKLEYSKLKQNQNIENTNFTNNTYENFYNKISFSQTIYNTFINFGHSIHKDLKYRIGLSSELLKRQLTDNETNKKDLFNILPFASINYEFHDNELSISYRKKIRYPKLKYLVSYNSNLDRQNIKIGNPNLDTQNEHNLELEYSKNFKKTSIVSSVFYTHTNNIINYVTTQQDNFTTTSPVNIGNADIVGMEFYSSNQITKWLKSNFTINATHNKIYSYNDNSKSNIFNSFHFNCSNYIKIKDLNLQLNWDFTSPKQLTYQQQLKSIQYFTLGASYPLFNKKGTITLSLLDPFNSRKETTTISDTDFIFTSNYAPISTQFSVSFFYRFDNKRKIKEQNTNNDTLFE